MQQNAHEAAVAHVSGDTKGDEAMTDLELPCGPQSRRLRAQSSNQGDAPTKKAATAAVVHRTARMVSTRSPGRQTDVVTSHLLRRRLPFKCSAAKRMRLATSKQDTAAGHDSVPISDAGPHQNADPSAQVLSDDEKQFDAALAALLAIEDYNGAAALKKQKRLCIRLPACGLRIQRKRQQPQHP